MGRLVSVLTLVVATAALTSVGFSSALAGRGARGLSEPLPLPSPTPITPVAVPGSNLRHNVATPKPGYVFAQIGKAVDVQDNLRARRMGTYICVDAVGAAWPQGCYIQFAPTDITCKGQPSGGGLCQLTAAPPLMRSPH